jgi:hypothetical protein
MSEAARAELLKSVQTIELDKWSKVVKCQRQHWMYRGQPDKDWAFESSLERVLRKLGSKSELASGNLPAVERVTVIVSGKTILARRMATILPPMTMEESLDVKASKSAIPDPGPAEPHIIPRQICITLDNCGRNRRRVRWSLRVR